MQKEFKQVFLDNSDNIYVTDIKDVLYLFDKYSYYPFIESLDNIKNCFFMGDRFFVHHSRTISIFDETLTIVKLQNSWITDKIDKVCYCTEDNAIVTLEDGEVHVYFNVSNNRNQSDDDVVVASISHAYKTVNGEKYVGCQIFQDIKIVGNFLLTFNYDTVKIFDLQKNFFKYIMTMTLEKTYFDEICEIDLYLGIFTLESGGYLFFLENLPDIELHEKNLGHFEIFKKQHMYCWISHNKFCFYFNKNKFNDIVKPLLMLLQSEQKNISNNQNKYCSDWIDLSQIKSKVKVINGKSTQLIVIDKKVYSIDGELKEIVLTDDLILFNFDCELPKYDINFVIDIENNRSVLDQLINIIPNIYRLNNEVIYAFQQIDSNGNIISFGDGVTRHVFNSLRNDIDTILKNNLESVDHEYAIKLGKIFYFCHVEGSELFSNIHPYFFYLLSEKSDHITLLKMFKGNDFELYYNQYIEYDKNPLELSKLELEINTIEEYIQYLILDNLTSNQKLLYESFVKGFLYFATRNKFYKFIKKLPVMFYIENLIATDFFNANLDFLKISNEVDKNMFKTFCDTFNTAFMNLTRKETSMFLQNVTGSQYYADTVHIVFAYIKQNLEVKQIVYDENIDINEDVNGDDEIENNEMIISLNNSSEKDNDPIYKISTCDAELIINIMPSEENIIEIIRLLTIEDLNMKN
jgi:hypothetical protein